MVEGLREAEIRAATAEAALATERARVEDMKSALSRIVDAKAATPAHDHIDAPAIDRRHGVIASLAAPYLPGATTAARAESSTIPRGPASFMVAFREFADDD